MREGRDEEIAQHESDEIKTQGDSWIPGKDQAISGYQVLLIRNTSKSYLSNDTENSKVKMLNSKQLQAEKLLMQESTQK